MMTIHDDLATAAQWIEHIATLDADACEPDTDPRSRLGHWRWQDNCGHTAEAIADLGDAEACRLYSVARSR